MMNRDILYLICYFYCRHFVFAVVALPSFLFRFLVSLVDLCCKYCKLLLPLRLHLGFQAMLSERGYDVFNSLAFII